MLLTQTGGILKPFAMIMSWIMEGIFWFLHLFMEYPRTGIAIILFTIIMYVLMLPLTVKQQKFAKLSSKMNPEIQEIQAKYKGKKDQESMQKMQLETQAVYQKYGVNPSGSCIQLLIQMPILFALYRVVSNIPAYVSLVKDYFTDLVAGLYSKIQAGGSDVVAKMFEGFNSNSARYLSDLQKNLDSGQALDVQNNLIDILNNANDKDWSLLSERFPDLAASVDSTHQAMEKFNSFLGLNIANSPSSVISTEFASDDKNWLLIIGVLMIPLLSAVTQWINTKLMPQAQSNKDGQEGTMASSMKTMNTIMPIMSAVFCFSLPIGLGIYWIAGSVVRSVIQIVVNKRLDKIDVEDMIKANLDKVNDKRRKAGLPPQQISTNATISTKNLEAKKEKTAEDKARIAQDIKDSTEYYNKNASKPGSLASKAAMVRQYNEKNNKENKDKDNQNSKTEEDQKDKEDNKKVKK